MYKTVVILLLSFYFPFAAAAQDVNGKPLPRTIPQPVYDRVLKNGHAGEDGSLNHWVLCGQWAQTLEDMLAGKPPAPPATPTPTPPPAGSKCSASKGWRVDGSLWKPESDSVSPWQWYPIILLPSHYWTTVQKIELFVGDKKVGAARFRSCCANGNRAHFDVTTKAKDLPKHFDVVITFKNGTSECRAVNDPHKRHE